MAYFWLNPKGYRTVKIPGTSPSCYEFWLDDVHPMTLLDVDSGIRYQPDRHEASTDLGSIRRPWNLLVDRTEFELSFILHDSGYRKGGLYVSFSSDSPFTFFPMARKLVDEMMYYGIEAEGGSWIKRHGVYRFVRMFGGRAWNKHRNCPHNPA